MKNNCIHSNSTPSIKHLSDLLDAHQARPTEVKTSQQGKDHHHSLDQRKTAA